MTCLVQLEDLDVQDLPISSTHPNAPAIPSHADADAAQETPGVDMTWSEIFTSDLCHG